MTRRHATGEFDPPADAGPADVRATFLRQLPDADFCPKEDWVQVVNAQAGTTAAVTPDSRSAQTHDTAAAVDEYAERYWRLPTEDRREQWGRLYTRPADAPTAAFLKHLESGLGVVPAPVGDPMAAELGSLVRELYTLRPRLRAVRRATWLDTRDQQVNWEEAVGELWRADAASAELDPPLVTFLDNPSPPLTAVEPGTAEQYRPAYSVTSPAYSARDDEWEPTENSKPSSAMRWVLVVGGAVLVLTVIRLFIAGVSGTISPQPFTPSYTPYQPGTLVSPSNSFTEDEVRAFEQFQYRANDPLPPRYVEWLGAGKPKANSFTYPPAPPARPSYTRPTKLWTQPTSRR